MNRSRATIAESVIDVPDSKIFTLRAIDLAKAFGEQVASELAFRPVTIAEEAVAIQREQQAEIDKHRAERARLEERRALGFVVESSEFAAIARAISNVQTGRSIFVNPVAVPVSKLRELLARPEPVSVAVASTPAAPVQTPAPVQVLPPVPVPESDFSFQPSSQTEL